MSNLLRARVVEVDDGGPYQKVTVEAGGNQRFTSVLRPQPFGFSSTPPADATGFVLFRDGLRELPLLIGLEHPDHRPRASAAGGAVIYGAQGEVVSVVNKTVRIVTDTVEIVAGTITLNGDVYVGGADGARRIVLDGDPVVGSVVKSTATRAYGL